MFLQVIYDKSTAGKKLGKYTGISLAWWHTYKWCTKKIMQVFANDIIAPLFHHLFPGKKYAPKIMSHSANTTYLSYIRLAYPHFQQALSNALVNHNLNTKQLGLLHNLQDLCEYFIPTVLCIS